MQQFADTIQNDIFDPSCALPSKTSNDAGAQNQFWPDTMI